MINMTGFCHRYEYRSFCDAYVYGDPPSDGVYFRCEFFPVRTGTGKGVWKKSWHNSLIGHEYEECSICGCMISDTEKFWDCNFCPNCGAKMFGGI